MTSLLSLPDTVLLDLLPPLLTNQDLATLRSLNKQSYTLFSDEILWKRRVIRDFAFPSYASARVGGWRRLYAGLSSPTAYIWGESTNGRMPFASSSDVSSPQEVSLPSRAIEMITGGWSFHVRTTSGQVIYWGTLNGDGFGGPWSTLRDPHKVVSEPTILPVPPVSALSGGRLHAVALTAGGVLEWRAWGSVWLHRSLDQVIQLEAGWDFTAVLLSTGTVKLWYTDWSLHASSTQHPEETEKRDLLLPLEVPQLTLPPLANIRKIAAGDKFLLALTDSGVYTLSLVLPPPPSVLFFSPSGSRRSPTEAHRLQLNAAQLEWTKHNALSTAHPTHISAHFHHLVAYSPTQVLLAKFGHKEVQRIQELQDKGVIKVVMGDYHFGALTQDGEVFTWGQWSRGALGLGEREAQGNLEDIPSVTRTRHAFNPVARVGSRVAAHPEHVDRPTKVDAFGANKFAFDIAFAGWHSSALAMDVAHSQ